MHAETSLSDTIRKKGGISHEKRLDPGAGRADACGVSDRLCGDAPYYDCYSNVSTSRNGYVNGTNGYGGMYNGTNYNPGYNGAATARAARQAAEPRPAARPARRCGNEVRI